MQVEETEPIAWREAADASRKQPGFCKSGSVSTTFGPDQITTDNVGQVLILCTFHYY